MIRDKLKLVPEKPGCYLMKDKENSIIYVGKAKNLKRRVSSYFNKIHIGKTKALVENICDFEYIITNSETESLILEINLIKKYDPKYNILLKDDKTYPYILLTNDKCPTLKIERFKNRKKVKGKLFGPFPNVTSARNTVNLINRIYPLRKCSTMGKSLCLYYHINECLGYCSNTIDKEKLNSMIKEIEEVLNGNYKVITKRLEEKMESASLDLNYEKALELKNTLMDIKKTINKQIIVSSVKYNFDVFGIYEENNYLTINTLFVRDGVVIGKINKIISDYVDLKDVYVRYIIDFYEKHSKPKQIVVNDIIDIEVLSKYLSVKVLCPKRGDIKKILNMANLNAEISSRERLEQVKRSDSIRISCIKRLEELLSMDKIERIELFDNSHLFGSYYVGAMVVYENFIANKNEYRKYKISLEKSDDLSAMKEVIYRRYYKVLINNLKKPDLIIVDGGAQQVSVAKEIIDSLKLSIKVIGLKKDDKHRTNSIIDDDLSEIDISHDTDLFLYLTRMQDEVHRYAITYHRNIKSKGALASILDNAEGIGPKRRKELLKHFSSLTKIKEASVEELSTILPMKVAISLKEFLNNE